MSLVIPIGGWVIISWGRGGGGPLKLQGVVKKREYPDFRSPEVGIGPLSGAHLDSHLHDLSPILEQTHLDQHK